MNDYRIVCQVHTSTGGKYGRTYLVYFCNSSCNSNRQITSYLERTTAVSSSIAVQS